MLHITCMLLFFFLLCPHPTLTLNSDGLSLLALKAAVDSDPTGALSAWSDTDPTPCRWPGVLCSPNNRVTQLSLPNKSLSGYLPSELASLTSLYRLSLPYNNFSRTIPAPLFTSLNKLLVLDLSHNQLTGPIPIQVRSLKWLRHFDLSSNSLNDSLPQELSELSSLVGTCNLSFNHFSGGIPPSLGKLPVIVSLDLRGNNLTGKIPQVGSLLNQGPTAFAGNPGLCGFPLQNSCPESQKPNILPADQPQNPKALRAGGAGSGSGAGEDAKAKERSGSVAVLVISGLSLVVGMVSLSLWVFRRRWNNDDGKMRSRKLNNEVIGGGDGGAIGGGEGQQGKFVVVDEGFNLELEDLLRASAYVVGKSRSGIVYKVVGVGKGGTCAPPPPATVVAVRRLSEGDATWRLKDFESEVEAIAKVRHPNVVPLRAYYFANDEKLLITDFIRNGSLHAALHGGSSNSVLTLSWTARLKIAQEAARGLMYIHEFGGRKYVHGNLKSTKILLDDDLCPYISGFGLTRLGLGTTKSSALAPKRQNSSGSSTMVSKAAASSNNYLAPEVRMAGGRFSQKCDVYSFGIILLELLTGKLPDFGPENDDMVLESFVRKAFREEQPLSEIIDPALLPEVYAKKQVVSAFHVALNCTELDPELRPRMKIVSESLDHIKIQ
ncbi:receptor protein kinase-like protein ZAR1 [Arachis duranensis]|uniref:Receptor protein kinase-like protein ZAR1 n=1 Tax=Arachis duranensis TaxID=130453 RepID=A0A6P4DU92_ARADU|nr:receptor protein kinase-like protein ZAR1 [Arachis duranensis]